MDVALQPCTESLNACQDDSTDARANVDPETLARLRLAFTTDVGPLLRQRLMETFGSATDVLQASLDELQQVRGVGPKIARQLLHAEQRVDVDALLAQIHQANLQILLPNDWGPLRLLDHLPDPPGALIVRGKLAPADQLAVAIVGTRRATRYGAQQAQRLAAGLARAGFTIVSGMARGIDGAAHRGALEAGGRTLAVLAGGVLNPYPPEHAELAEQIALQGALLSEALPTMAPLKGMFPQRNRLISGLSLGTVVIEAAHRSGALITARHAMEQGREVFAVPGLVDNPLTVGPHRLIRDGAKLTTCVEDIIEELGPLAEQAEVAAGKFVRAPAEMRLNEVEQAVLQAIDPEGSSLDEVCRLANLPISRVLATVTVLESRSLVAKTGGNRVTRR